MIKLLPLLIMIGLVSCKGTGDSLNMAGTYSMIRQVLNDDSKDSVLVKKQFKIYTDHYMIYASHISETDSLADYGIATYRIENGRLIENLFYRASEGDKKDSVILKIYKTQRAIHR